MPWRLASRETCRHFCLVDYRAPQALPLRGYAVFLDIDGTLLDIAATPDDVIVPPHLHVLLRRLGVRLQGAVALISGRRLADIDRLIGPGIAVAAEHGAILRDAEGRIIASAPESAALARLTVPMRALVASHPGAALEEKHFGLVIHWRANPAIATSLGSAVAALAAPYPGLMLQPAREALEIRVCGTDKAAALETFLRTPPFTGRRPLFIGDDLTDEPAIIRANALGGQGLHVARDFGGSPTIVRNWLEASLEEEEDNG
jgi:trehalose 6-phosphate phosphatase